MAEDTEIKEYKRDIGTLKNKLGIDGTVALIRVIIAHKKAAFDEFITTEDLREARNEALTQE